VLAAASAASAQPALDAALAGARAQVEQEIAAQGLPGFALTLAVGDSVVWRAGYGFADLEHGVPASPAATRFRVGSLSKPFTAVALARLVDAGRLDPDAPIQATVPAFPPKRWPVTVRALGGHLAGVRHYRADEFLSARHVETVAEALALFAADTLLAPPGTAYHYSSYGWNLLSAAVEGAVGEPFLDHMRREVFAPLGMAHTVADHTDSLLVGRARPYARDPDRWDALLNAPYVDNSIKWAGGGFLSTTDDLVRFAQGAVLGDFVGAAGRALMFTEQRTNAGEPVGYGVGWRLVTDERGRRRVFHGGGSVGGTSLLLVLPEQRLVVAAATNLTGANLGFVADLAGRLADALGDP
jgi:CubicO group peptidase (beta-lactamase class C family)